MSERRRPGMPLQKARRIQAENQARGQRARTHLEKSRKRHRDALRNGSRSGRRSTADLEAESGRRRIGLVLAFVASVGLGLLVGLPVFDLVGDFGSGEAPRIDVISVQGNRLLSSRVVAAATGVQPGQIRTEVDPQEVSDRLRAHPWIRDAQVMRLPTGTLLISIDEREPVALLAPEAGLDLEGEPADRDETWRFVDASGTPFAHWGDASPARLDREDAEAWPRLRGGERLADGQAHPELTAALALARHLRDARLGALLGDDAQLELWLPQVDDPQGWVLDSGPGRLLVILGHDQLLERLGRLETLLRSELDEVRDARQIDLRFVDRAILRSSSVSG